MTGKVIRYLQENGADVEAGQPYVEVEAMKMVMPIKATESGKITHNLSPGSVITAGDLLASLELRDPSKVKKIEEFTGTFSLPVVAIETEPDEVVQNILHGFKGDPEAAASAVFESVADLEAASALVRDSLAEFLRVENLFIGKLTDDVVRDLSKENAENLDVVIDANLAHQQLKMRSNLVLAMLRQVETFADRFGMSQLPEDLLAVLEDAAALKGKEYGEIAIAADAIIRQSKVPSFDSRVDELRSQLMDSSTNLAELSKSSTLSAGVDLLTYIFSDGNEPLSVREAALEVYVRRVYRAHRVLDLSVKETDGRATCSFTFQFADVEASQAPLRQGMLSVIPSLKTLDNDLPKILDELSSTVGGRPSHTEGGEQLNMIHLAVADGQMGDVDDIEAYLVSQASKLEQLGVRTVNILIPKPKKEPSYYTFPQCDGYKEDPLRRDMRPTFHHLLELARLNRNFELERIPSISRNAQVYIGTEKTDRPVRGGPQQVVFVRGISHNKGLATNVGAQRALQQGLDELERAAANSKVNPQSSSRIFLHSLHELENTTPQELAAMFKKIIATLKSHLATRLLKLRVDEIEVKLRVSTTGEDGQPLVQNVRLVASSIEGEWLKPTAYLENPDPITGVTTEFCLLDDGDAPSMCFLDPYDSSNVVQTKRAIARRVGSTYAYDFLGLMEVGLVGEWEEYSNR